MSKQGHLFIIAAPSGAGKTSLVRAILASMPGMKISISYTTRPPRPADEHGKDYFFVSEAEFQRLVNENAFLEHATVFGNHYGTRREWVLEQLNEGIDVLLEIDWQGARQIRSQFPTAVLIFILPPSLEILQHRLQQRSQQSQEVIAGRMQAAQTEIAHCREFDYLLVNDDFAKALADLTHIIQAVRLRTEVQQEDWSSLLAELLEKQ